MSFTRLRQFLANAISRRKPKQTMQEKCKPPMTESERRAKQQIEIAASENYLKYHTKKCPSCGRVLVKDGGCNQMECKLYVLTGFELNWKLTMSVFSQVTAVTNSVGNVWKHGNGNGMHPMIAGTNLHANSTAPYRLGSKHQCKRHLQRN